MPARASVPRQLARGLLLAAGVAGAAAASAQARTNVTVTVPVEIEHDSNPNLTVGPSASTTWLRATPSVTARYVPGNEEFDFDAALTAEKSSNQEAARDRLDPRLRAAWKHVDPRNTTELALLVDRRAFRALDVREQVPLGVDGSRTLYALSGSWLRELDARTTVAAEARQDWERFTDANTQDFRNTTAAVRFTRQQDERRSWYVGVNGQLYAADNPSDAVPVTADGTRSRAFGAVLGITQALSDAWRIDANVGPAHLSSSSSGGNWQGAVKLEYTAARWVAGLDLSRAPGVNATFGGVLLSDEARVRVRYDLDARSRIELDAGHAREQAAGSSRTAASLAWVRQWSPSWQLAVRGSTHRQEGPEGTARSNRIAVLLVYTTADL